MLKSFQYVLLVIMEPLMASLGLITYTLIINSLKSKHKQKQKQQHQQQLLDDPMYQHLLINSIFNIFFCIIMLLKLLNTCVFVNAGVYCSSVYQSDAAQYFKIIAIIFGGNMIKVCCNISYAYFVLARLVLISNSDSKLKFLKKISKISHQRVHFICLLLTGGLLNVYNLLQYRLNTELDERLDFPYEVRNEDLCQDNPFECSLFDSFKITTKLINDVLIFLIVITADTLLLKYVREDIAAKSHVHTDEASKKKLCKCRKNANHMVAASGALFGLAHFPDFLITILMTSYRKEITNFCAERLSCDLVNEETQVFNLFSMSGQFFILVKCNSRFRESFIDSISQFKCWKKSGPESKRSIPNVAQKNNPNDLNQKPVFHIKALNNNINPNDIQISTNINPHPFTKTDSNCKLTNEMKDDMMTPPSNPDTNFSCNNLPNTISKNDPSEEPNIQFNVNINNEEKC